MLEDPAPVRRNPTSAVGRRRSFALAVSAADVESAALVVGAVAFVVCAVPALILFWGRQLPISGSGSLGTFIAIAGAIAAALAFVLARIIVEGADADVPRGVRYHWFDLAALALGHGAIALLGWIGIATVMEHSFQGATVYASPAAVIAGAAVALSAYVSFLSGAHLSPGQLSLVLALFLVVGMFSAMLSASDPRWWEMNLSALGITHDISSLTFNLTIIVSGVIITTIARFGTASLPTDTVLDRRKRMIVRGLFVLIGILLACVGIFPVDRFFLLHNTVATGMGVAYALLVLGLPWLVPALPRMFLALGFVYVGAMIVLGVLFALGEYNLTAVELISALLIFSWIIIFLRSAQNLGARAGTDAGESAVHPDAAGTR